MKYPAKRLSILFFIIISFYFCFNCFAQEPGKLPDDPRVRVGKLPNGLSYTVIKNKTKKGYATFCMAQKTGFSLEEEGERGMSKMLEPLLLMGTRNFTDSTIIKYLNSLGVLNDDIIFDTQPDRTTYFIKDVPVVGKNTIDSTLLIIYNWLSSVNIDEEDVAQEMPFLKNKIADEWSYAGKRMDYKLIKELYPKSPYAICQTPNDAINFKAFNSKELRNFYYRWYRPDFQSVIIIGDIDLDVAETQIKSIFATIPKPMKKQNRSYYAPKPFQGIKVCVLKDKEYNKTLVSVDFLVDPIPPEYRNTNLPYIKEYMEESISKLFADRLREGIKLRNLPISDIKIFSGEFMNMNKQYTYSISFETVPEAVYSSLSFLSSEISRLVSDGFTWHEFSVAKEIYLRKLEDLYNSRANLSNDIYLERALNNFFGGYSLASIEMKFEMMKSVLSHLGQMELNNYAASLLGAKDNIVITCRMPQYRDIQQLSEDRILTAYKDILTTSKVTSMLKAEVITWPKFEPESKKSSIITETEDPVTGSKVYLLSNGATVIYKKIYNAKDTLSFRVVGKGGFSLLNGINKEKGDFINGIINIGGLGNISQPNIERLYSYYNLDVKAKITLNTQELTGYSENLQAEKLFHAIYLNFTQRRADEGAFNAYKKEKIFDKLYLSLSPRDVFRDSVVFYNNANAAYVRNLDLEEIRNIQYYPLLTSCRKLFANASDFTFTFVGNADDETIKNLTVKYIGSIPGDINKKENWRILPYYSTKGNVYKRFLFNMEIPRTYGSIDYTLGVDYTIENKVLINLLGSYLRYMLGTSQSKKAASSLDVISSLDYYPEKIAKFEIKFISNNENEAMVEESIYGALDKLAGNGITKEEFSGLLKMTSEEHLQKSKRTYYWLHSINERYITGQDFINNYINILNGITKEQLCGFAKKLLDNGNRVTVIMEGTTKDVETENLLKNNKFIKDFFSL